MTASDSDIGTNAVINFKLEGEDSNAFSIDKNTATIQISSKAKIDFESKKAYFFQVSAIDKAGTGMKVYANISVSVVDINDNKPVFSRSVYNVTVPESVGIGHFLVNLNASDADSGYYGAVSYRIVSGSSGKFSIDAKSGVLQTQAQLDRETLDSYTLNISAYDGGLPASVSYCIVFVNVTDVNDNYPVFVNTLSEIRVAESVAVGSYVTSIQATDADLNEGQFIDYGMNSDSFKIDRRTGVIRTSAQLDREIVGSYKLIVTATDSGEHSSNLSLLIRVDDVNDNRPYFLTASPMTIDVFEKTPNGSIITIVEAIDKDFGMNGRVEYTLSESSGYLLTIDNKTGILR